MRLTPAIAAVVLSMALAACSSGTPVSESESSTAPRPSVPQIKQLAWGQPAEVLGTNLRKLRVTPFGLLYHRGPYNGIDGPANGWFVAIAVKAEAITQPETVAGGAGGGGFSWRGAGQTIDIVGNSAPWEGSVNLFSVDVPLEPGSPEAAIVTFDVPSKTGGRLLYVSPEDQSIVSWTLPSTDQGRGLEGVRKQIARFS